MSGVVPHNCVEPLLFTERRVVRNKIKYNEARNGVKLRTPLHSRILTAWVDIDGDLNIAVESNTSVLASAEYGLRLVGHGGEVPMQGQYLASVQTTSKRIGSTGSVTKHVYVV